MGSESISSLILFIAAMLVAASVAGVLVTNVSQLSGSIDTYGGDVSDRIDTNVEIVSDPGSDGVYDAGNETVRLYVKNTGSRTLADDGTELDVLVDGEYVHRENLTVSVLDGSSWRPGTVAEVEIEVEGGLDQGEHRVALSVRGDEEIFEFYLS